ncbi:1-aminocyclopropane-1-carboxylate deaminase/D-cysteine desulfhydrase [Echinicola strongylocentroti]|uniref:1-aminocyclopropane-1-carboxylate deaminase/D-cysteine desulfhydrase n=1 Tax=Echinicola strongylocentroti TaxID=1795355 RepID=A0A2Z4IIG6_9BACT|nr:pyridoxal-phosphate dependent enzyme [Echinicola strongylocentroti]AWW30346.1 1-aminocyclopropane-1-carboxylate deaminase/D-cysteine desulfhydrase [Echinicola strongylocentroti]
MNSILIVVSTPVSPPSQEVHLPEINDHPVRLFVKRLDLIHPLAGGNKYYKLKYNLDAAKKAGHSTLLTLGGAYSNHIFATAAAGHLAGFKTIGVIRGEQPQELNPTLAKAHSYGMKLSFMDRPTYRKKNEKAVIDELHKKFGDFYLIPEGGTNQLAIQGTREILTAGDKTMDYVCCSIGTGGTIAGIIQSAMPHQNILGYSSLKGDFIRKELQQLLGKHQIPFPARHHIFTNYHFGGYAKHQPALIQFIKDFKEKTDIPLDPIYTGKLAFGVIDQIKSGYFPNGSKILLIHSGGLQGITGFNQRFGETLDVE